MRPTAPTVPASISEYVAICLNELLDAGIDEGAHFRIFDEVDLTELLRALDDENFVNDLAEHMKPYLVDSLEVVVKDILREERK
jgi:hypothetical protein